MKSKRGADVEPSRLPETWFIERLLEAGRANEIRLITSAFALVECVSAGEDLPNPVSEETKQMFSDFLWSGEYVELVAFDPFIAERARDLRWVDNVKIKNADAIHVATGLLESANEFLTFDDKLKKRYAPLENKMRLAGMSATTPSNTGCLSAERQSATMFTDSTESGC